jgi:hypothetical protein
MLATLVTALVFSSVLIATQKLMLLWITNHSQNSFNKKS